jgi:hypothetical protein
MDATWKAIWRRRLSLWRRFDHYLSGCNDEQFLSDLHIAKGPEGPYVSVWAGVVWLDVKNAGPQTFTD